MLLPQKKRLIFSEYGENFGDYFEVLMCYEWETDRLYDYGSGTSLCGNQDLAVIRENRMYKALVRNVRNSPIK